MEGSGETEVPGDTGVPGDVSIPADAGAAPGRPLGTRRPETTLDDLDRRLAGLERRLERLTANLEAVSESLETSVATVVAAEVKDAAADLRHTMSELGRILVRDVGKLPQMLAQHRKEIVVELTRAAAATPAPLRTASALPGPAEASKAVTADHEPPVVDSAPAVADGEPDPAANGGSPPVPDDDDAGRRWRPRRRHQD